LAVNNLDDASISVRLNLGDQVVPADIRVLSATATGATGLVVSYEITGSDLTGPFDIAFYRSGDARFDASDGPALSVIQISDPLDFAQGVHTKTFTIGTGAGQVALPTAVASDSGDYYLLAVADPADVVPEDDGDGANEDNTQILTGVYHLPGGGVFVHGGQ